MKAHLPSSVSFCLLLFPFLMSCASNGKKDLASDDFSLSSAAFSDGGKVNVEPHPQISDTDDRGLGNPADQNSSGENNLILPAPARPTLLNPAQPNSKADNVSWSSLPAFGKELFMAGGPTQKEIIQGPGDTCTIFAALTSLVLSKPDIVKQMFRLVGVTSDGVDVYSVRIYGASRYDFQKKEFVSDPQDIVVDARLLVYEKSESLGFQYDRVYFDPLNGNFVLWPSLLQKALAVYYGGYEQILKSAPGEIHALTGQEAISVFNSSSVLSSSRISPLSLRNYVGNQFIVTVDSSLTVPSKANDASATMVDRQAGYNCAYVGGGRYCLAENHEYAVLAVDEFNVTLQNPWQENLGVPSTSNGLITMPFAAFTALTVDTWRSALLSAVAQ